MNNKKKSGKTADRRKSMKAMKKVGAVLLASILTFSLAACGESEGKAPKDEENKAEKTSADVKIGYISPGPDTWYLRAEEGAKWACEQAGAEFISVNSNRDSEQEQTNIDYLIDEGVDCIVILSWNEAGCVSAAEKCKDAGIGCVVFDACGVMKNHDVDITASVDFDWQSMGGTYVEWMTESYPGENYVFISGTMDSVV